MNATQQIIQDARGVRGFESTYVVTRQGDVYRKDTGKKRKPQDHKGYHRVWLYDRDKSMNCRVHRLVAEAYIPNPDDKPFVNHKNGVKTDNRVENLEWVTSSENNEHARQNGLSVDVRGSRQGLAKLDEQDVLEIRNAYPEKTKAELAKEYGLHPTTIGDVVGGYTWKHVEMPDHLADGDTYEVALAKIN